LDNEDLKPEQQSVSEINTEITENVITNDESPKDSSIDNDSITEDIKQKETNEQEQSNLPLSEQPDSKKTITESTPKKSEKAKIIKKVDSVSPVTKALKMKVLPRTSWMYLISMVFFGTFAMCILLSCYYRLQLIRNKRAPFNAPKGLQPLFPAAVNYEYEITQLCDKYLSQ